MSEGIDETSDEIAGDVAAAIEGALSGSGSLKRLNNKTYITKIAVLLGQMLIQAPFKLLEEALRVE